MPLEDNVGEFLLDFALNLVEPVEVEKKREGLFREDPVDIITFFEGGDFLTEKLYPKQRELVKVIGDIVMYKLLPQTKEAAEKIPDWQKHINEINFILGKGCIHGDAKIRDAETGKVYTFKELAEKRKSIKVNSFNTETYKSVITQADVPWIKGHGSIYEVTTTSGRKTKVFGEHLFLTKNESSPAKEGLDWKKCSEMNVNDLVAISTVDFDKNCNVDPGINQEPIYWDRIKSIEYVGEDYYYDVEVPETANYVADGFIHHNSGKDFLISRVLCYIMYYLNCMYSPQEYITKFKGIRFAEGENIDILNVAHNADQANRVFFNKFKVALRSCKKFEEIGGRRQVEEPFQFKIMRDYVQFLNNVNCYSKHSKSGSWEGLSPLIVIYDEIDAFEGTDDEDSYQTGKSSASSRFNNDYLLIFISYPRSEDGFMFKKEEEANTQLKEQGYTNIYSVKYPTWEVNLGFNHDTYLKHYEKEPEEADMFYKCDPPQVKQGFFKFPHKIFECVQIGRTNQVYFEDGITERQLDSGEIKRYVSKELVASKLNPNYVYYLGGDAGIDYDSYTLCLVHAEPTIIKEYDSAAKVEVSKLVNKPVEDLLLTWKPIKKEGLPVDLINVSDVAQALGQKVYIKKALTDSFNSAEFVQRLIDMGIDAEDKQFSMPFQLRVYSQLRSLIYTGVAELLDYPEYNEQLKNIIIENGKKITHRGHRKVMEDETFGKDQSDARASAFWLCATDIPETQHTTKPSVFSLSMKKLGN